MELAGRCVVVTGAGSGIGRALAERFAREDTRVLIVADIAGAAARETAAACGGVAVEADVGSAEGVQALVDRALVDAGQIDLFCSNAGIPGPGGGPEAPDDEWQRIWQVNVMSHVWAARALLPGMLQRGEGYLLNTASAAGLLTQVGALPYSVTKHAAVAVAEWLSITYGDRGIRVSCLCPQAVRTPMLEDALEDPVGAAALLADEVLEPADVAEVTLQAIREERFLILPHPSVGRYMALKGNEPERWLAGMRKLVRRASSS